MNNIPIESHIRGAVRDLLRTRGIAKTGGLIRDISGVKKVPYIGLKNRLSLQVREKEDENNRDLNDDEKAVVLRSQTTVGLQILVFFYLIFYTTCCTDVYVRTTASVLSYENLHKCALHAHVHAYFVEFLCSSNQNILQVFSSISHILLSNHHKNQIR